MKVSIFTPSNKPDFLDEILKCLQAQTYKDWEWIVLLNNGAGEWGATEDSRVKVYRDDSNVSNVGFLKRTACSLCTGDILLELDHDDLLAEQALEKCVEAFKEDPEIVFVYSDSITHDVIADKPVVWDKLYGWSTYEVEFQGKKYTASRSAEPDPQSISRIWFAPNHFRAWRTEAYWEIGGHNGGMKISDDHDLMMRTWLFGKMKRIPEALYLYRVHGENTWLKYMDEIQITMWEVHDKYITDMAKKWSKEKGLRAIDLCGALDTPKGFESIDIRPEADIVTDLEKDWPLEDSSVGVLRAQDALEHLKDPIHTMNEAWRVLAHGGFFFIAVPSTSGPGAWADPTHKSFWNTLSFHYYTDPRMRRYIEPSAKCKFQVIKLIDGTTITASGVSVPYVFAHLVAIKESSPRFYGEQRWN